MGGVGVQTFVPKDGIARRNRKRVLINMHGGGLVGGALINSQVESIPIAAIAGIKVISVDYRLGPENRYPAANEDLNSVYREALRTYKPRQIGIFGCSAGGSIVGQSIGWFRKAGLPRPAAIAVFCNSMGLSGGDSSQLSWRAGSFIPSPASGRFPSFFGRYFQGVDMNDPLVSPAKSPRLLSTFPPTLLITGTRAPEMSAVTRTHVNLLMAGVDARLALWDGLDHGFMGNPDMPESREVYRITERFFDEHLAEGTPRRRA